MTRALDVSPCHGETNCVRLRTLDLAVSPLSPFDDGTGDEAIVHAIAETT